MTCIELAAVDAAMPFAGFAKRPRTHPKGAGRPSGHPSVESVLAGPFRGDSGDEILDV